jgi:hypothetical protein
MQRLYLAVMQRLYPAVILSNLRPAKSNSKRRPTRETRMVRRDFGYLPRENPCAQCGAPIAAPDWTENGPRRISYLWHCKACDYKFEAVAFYDASHADQPLAA